ncbi:hypothetical protein niasHT_036465 [Heterodera trifolii]|uniref:V-type proton ATPase subunit a n=1 Tax=Heterodera trifolii TaxID=157864 RepID=A0ABD2IVC2_9BILA
MGSLYRSEEMRFCQLIVERDAAFSCVAELGKHPFVQFKDLNAEVNVFQRMFTKDIRRFDEMERKLRFLEVQIRKENQPIVDNTWGEAIDVMSHGEINEVEQKLIDKERDIISMNDSDQQLKKNFLELKEWQYVLSKTDEFFQGGISDAAVQEIEGQTVVESDIGIPLRSEKDPMGHVVGVINAEKVNAFERIIWRVCRRTAFVRHAEIDEVLEHPESGESIKESVFIVFYNGERLRHIIDKVCEGFKAKQFNQCPKTSTDRQTALQQVHTNIHDMRMVMSQTSEHRMRVLNEVAANHRKWLKQVRIHKSIYHTLNTFTFDGIGKFFVAECWVPLSDVNDVRMALETGVNKFGGSVKPVLNVVHTAEPPPTYNRTNKFTSVFQGIVDSYGIASYLELNPAPYTIITFPFLFSIMFGDLGHGILMFFCGLFLVLREKNLEARQIKDEIFNMFFGGRYIILLMGLFSIHAGLLYNDAFAKSFQIFGSAWANIPYNDTEIDSWLSKPEEAGKEMEVHLNPMTAYDRARGPYPFGMDPVWNLADNNKLNFLNSMKMKLSVIVGITQMTFGVALSYRNYKFFESPIEVFTVFIPQLVFMSSIFIYLCLQIIAKWLFFWVEPTTILTQDYPGPHCAPSLLIGLINMFMFKSRDAGFQDDNGKELPGCYLNQWYPGQSFVEAILVIIAVLCIPIMLFGKPFHILMHQRRAKRAVSDNMSVRINMQKEEMHVIRNGRNGTKHDEVHSVDDAHDHVAGAGGGAHHDESFGDIMVHQSIHTIEYVLGCVSHTASYLRLWALSLAHAQLSEVLWTMVLKNAFAFHLGVVGYFVLYFIFFAFAVLTFSILVLMEGLSAFLHTLRLHWVEFQSKFYLGQGYAFTPFFFKDILEKANAADTA